MMRLFVALALPGDVRSRLVGLCAGVPGARWVEPEDMHLTLRFIGEIEEHLLSELHDALAGVIAPSFDLVLEGLGQFGAGHQARTLWLGVSHNENLLHLQAKVESALVRAGLPPEPRKFTPHVTLARLKEPSSERLARFLAGNGMFRSQPITVDRFILYRSYKGRAGPLYEALAEYPTG
ncbi:MAG: RNA 2',3'-cyclic phosphodiesterase [Rhodospirillaceae bacterium]